MERHTSCTYIISAVGGAVFRQLNGVSQVITSPLHTISHTDTLTSLPLGSCAKHLTVEYTVGVLLTVILIISSIPSPTHSFIPGLKPSFSANPSHCSLSFSSSGLTTWIPWTVTVTSEHIRFYFLVFSVLHFLVVGSVR